ncbi:nitrate reductase (quinol-dependent), transmembrane subunit [Verrucomicrobium sp. GAS474]|uniref:DmsC/YnfH family molybdoenzyme membrane anchor subunit n=1 Tax=Verrucomicrobium sp. GAS474 TaxID=1882831 RepID=UPI00087DDA99|nr:DmsC/YnfH family molybdoenzyme membrane anchor subunit [Verrucomicrobium sp. GAS474]SDT95432.1 nitrate reductase (quinol-dependent), transmembrane subunit [Verrucomicrobium sp. GAS474]
MLDLLHHDEGNDGGHATLVDLLLAEQRDLSAVDRFSERHARHAAGRGPALEGHYRALLPAAPPGEGEQYAFSVDLDACSGCKGCVSACHSLNGLDKEEEETWRSVGLIHGIGEIDRQPFQQTITTACHHCVEPGCLSGCPVLAYEKDARTGIVRHLDDQCIGCQYCVLKCPYDVPKYSPKRGIVRKCDMCASRLAADEAPACVQACPNEAITITVVRKGEVAERARRGEFLSGSPDPGITLPSTRYLSMRTAPATLHPADAHRLRPEPGHPPLVAMLVLTQASVGLLAADLGLRLLTPTFAAVHPPLVALAALLGLAGIGSSILHLGRPLGAWRAFLGLRTSWLSREIAAFGLFAALLVADLALTLMEPLAHGLLPSALVDPVVHAITWFGGSEAALRAFDLVDAGAVFLCPFVVALAALLLAVGLPAVWTSVMIYADTRREAWGRGRTAFRFYGTTLLLGLAGTVPILVLERASDRLAAAAYVLLLVLAFVKIVGEALLFIRPGFDAEERELSRHTPLQKTALLLIGPLRPFLRVRVVSGFLGGVILPFCLAVDMPGTATALPLAIAAAFLLLVGELAERYLFFASCAAPKMPGHFEN